MMHKYLFWALLLITCTYALWSGRRDERIVASACLAASIGTHFVIAPQHSRYAEIESGLLLIDLAMLATFVATALSSKRFWPLWVAGLQLTTSMSHLMKGLDFQLVPKAYAAAAALWSYPILIILAIGTWRSDRGAQAEQSSATAV